MKKKYYVTFGTILYDSSSSKISGLSHLNYIHDKLFDEYPTIEQLEEITSNRYFAQVHEIYIKL